MRLISTQLPRLIQNHARLHTQVDPVSGEVAGVFESIQPADSDMGAKDPKDVKVTGGWFEFEVPTRVHGEEVQGPPIIVPSCILSRVLNAAPCTQSILRTAFGHTYCDRVMLLRFRLCLHITSLAYSGSPQTSYSIDPATVCPLPCVQAYGMPGWSKYACAQSELHAVISFS